MQARVLVADSGSGRLAEVAPSLEAAGYRVERLSAERLDPERIAELVDQEERPDALVLEVGPPTASLLPSLPELPCELALVLLLAPGFEDSAARSLRLGADDAMRLPVDPDELALRVSRAIDRRRRERRRRGLETRLPRPRTRSLLLGESDAMCRVREEIARVAPGRATVLITGETGTGKELVATAIHESSPRSSRPFVKVNCAALPETLLESELFGHERGAFTGAEQRRIGRFEDAHGGTILLDEVGDMHARTQAKVLRVLQEREFERLGGSRPIRVDVRILAATNQDLEQGILEGSFRSDLFYRLNVVSVNLPALRERSEDVDLLARIFLREFNHEVAIPKRGFTPDAITRLRRYPWPGNVRELRNVVQRAVLMGQGERIAAPDLALLPRAPTAGTGVEPHELVLIPPEGVHYEDLERAMIVQALERTGWVQKEAARLLRMSRRRLHYRIVKLGITHEAWRRNRPEGGGGT